jgi:hypothetical protein
MDTEEGKSLYQERCNSERIERNPRELSKIAVVLGCNSERIESKVVPQIARGSERRERRRMQLRKN